MLIDMTIELAKAATSDPNEFADYFWNKFFPPLSSLIVALILFGLAQWVTVYNRKKDIFRKAKATALYCATALQTYSAECDYAKGKLINEQAQSDSAIDAIRDPIPPFPPLSAFRDFHELTTAEQTQILQVEMIAFFNKAALSQIGRFDSATSYAKLDEIAERALSTASILFHGYGLRPAVNTGRANNTAGPTTQRATATIG